MSTNFKIKMDIKNIKAQESNFMWMIIGVVVLILVILIGFLLAGKMTNLGNTVIQSFG